MELVAILLFAGCVYAVKLIADAGLLPYGLIDGNDEILVAGGILAFVLIIGFTLFMNRKRKYGSSY